MHFWTIAALEKSAKNLIGGIIGRCTPKTQRPYPPTPAVVPTTSAGVSFGIAR
jgi:hypothetical protein